MKKTIKNLENKAIKNAKEIKGGNNSLGSMGDGNTESIKRW